MKVKIVFGGKRSGNVSVKYGTLVSQKSFSDTDSLTVEIADEKNSIGSKATIVTAGNFSFFLRDVNSLSPIYVPSIEAVALPENDPRSYQEVAMTVGSIGEQSDFDRINSEPERTLEEANKVCRNRIAPTWLGIGPDIRGFWVDYRDERNPKNHDLDGLDFRFWGYIRPATQFHGVTPAEEPDLRNPYYIYYQVGTGPHCMPDITRRMEDGYLPILHATQRDGFVDYEMTAFATLENHTLAEENIKGTPNDIAYAYSGYPSNIRLPIEKIRELRLKLNQSETVVLRTRFVARNTAKTPVYAFFTAPEPMMLDYSEQRRGPNTMNHSFENGIITLLDYGKDKSVGMALLNGKPMPEKEISVLVMPGETAVFDMIVPSAPVSLERMKKMAAEDFRKHHAAARNYWKGILDRAAKVELPDPEIDNRLKAGLFHLLEATTGEKNGPLMASVGLRYSPIGSESAPMILTLDWLGLTDTAGRCIDYFFQSRQVETGAIRTYSNYENETGPALWTAAEHFKITRDLEWLKRNFASMKRAADFLIEWRNENKTEEYRAEGCYGLQKGKVDDPDDFYHSFYLNAGSYGGLRGFADIAGVFDKEYAAKLDAECKEYQQDIIHALHAAWSKSPACPLHGGKWIQHLPGWTEYAGDPAYHADGGEWNFHGTIFYRVQTNPPLYCGIFGVVDCRSEEMTRMLEADQTPHTIGNASYCQPYYVRNDYAFAMRGEEKLFLATFFNQLSAMQDRETYMFFEHYYSLPHKGHEEGWMLMQIRWMLFLEDGKDLHLLRCAPRSWFAPGKRTVLENVRSTLGKVSFTVIGGEEEIVCEYNCPDVPGMVTIRLPHYTGRKGVFCEGGTYDPQTETVRAMPGKGQVVLYF